MAWPDDPVRWISPAGAMASWVAEIAGTIVGHSCIVAGVEEPEVALRVDIPSERLATVSRLFVAPAGRGRGLGAALLAASAACASAEDRQLILEVVDDGGPAVALYERLGWRLVSRRRANWHTPQGLRPPLRIYLAPEAQSPL
jgi:GNAT superfamily N-acetyltransferase